MFYKIVPYKWILYSYSNLFVAKINQISLKIIPRLFTIDSLDKLRYVINMYNKVIDYSRKSKVDNVILTSVLNNWYISFNKKDEESIIIPNAIFLFLERPSPSNPYDFDLFKNDSKLWYNRLQQIKEQDFVPLFVYDPLHIPDILIYYIPLILINKNNEGGIHTTSCYTDIECKAYAEVEDFYILINIWIPSKESDYVKNFIHTNANNLVRLCNPFFCSNPFEYDHKVIGTVNYVRTAHQITSKGTDRFNVVVEFLTSCIAVMNNIMQSYIYLWLPVPSLELLRTIHRFFRDIKVYRLLVIDILGNFSELGSLHTDRMWIKILRHITEAESIKAIIGGTIN